MNAPYEAACQLDERARIGTLYTNPRLSFITRDVECLPPAGNKLGLPHEYAAKAQRHQIKLQWSQDSFQKYAELLPSYVRFRDNLLPSYDSKTVQECVSK